METDQLLASRYAVEWLSSGGFSLAVATYRAGLLVAIGGADPSGRIHLAHGPFERPMGLAEDSFAGGSSLWLSGAWRISRLEGMPPGRGEAPGFDRLLVPRVSYATGDQEVHDLAPDGRGGIVFVSTLMSCLVALDASGRQEVFWQPPFVSRLAPEDRCHLNGLASEDGKPRFVTVCARSDVADGWRESRRDGGAVLDVASGEVVLSGLSMPHSPRLYRGELWLVQAGTGELGRVDLERGRFEPVAFCPGYARGLAFHDRFAVLGTSLSRHHPTFSGLALEENLARRGASPRCGLWVIDVESGEVAHWFAFEGSVRELYDVAVLPGTVRPGFLGGDAGALRDRIWLVRGEEVSGWSRAVESGSAAPGNAPLGLAAPAGDPVDPSSAPFAVVELRPEGAVVPIYLERLGRLLASGLVALGRECRLERNTFPRGHVCLVLGSWWANPALFEEISRAVHLVLVQCEPLGSSPGLLERRLPVLRRARQVWDLSPRSAEVLGRTGLRARHLELGFSPELTELPGPGEPELDVLCLDPLDERHVAVFDRLRGRARLGVLRPAEREGRAARMASARVVLSVAPASSAPAPLALRLHEPLSQGAFVLCETQEENPYSGGVAQARYEDLADTCLKYLADAPGRRAIGEAGRRLVRERAMSEGLRPLVEGLS